MAHDGGGVGVGAGVGEGDHRGLHPRIVVGGQGTESFRVQRWD